MRLGPFRLERYGPFEHLDLPFDPTPGRLNVIVAPNGYGKSVIRRAIGALLFGIDARTPMTFRFGTERMQIRSDIVHNDKSMSLVRRKGNGNTLAFADGTEVSAEETSKILGAANETVFEELFGLDTALLRSGGRDLIHSQGRLGQVLFAAGGGMGRVRDLLTDLERKRDELGRATVRHRSRPIWAALSAWEQANTDLRRTALRPDGWTALQREATGAADTLRALLAEQAEQTAERDQLRTIGACRPWLDRLHTARQTLADAADAPDLDETFEKRWRDGLANRAIRNSGVEGAKAELQEAVEARATLGFEPRWIAAEAEITTLTNLRGAAVGAERDLPTVQRERTADMARSAALRRDLGWDDGFTLPPAPTVKDAQRLLQQHPALALGASGARDRVEEAERLLAETQAALGALPAAGDVDAIADLARLFREGGDPGTRRDTAMRKLREADAALRTALSAVADNPLTEATLGSTAAPSEARLDAIGTALSRAETAHEQAVQIRAARTNAIDGERTKLAALEQTAMLPAPGALAAARAEREALWTQMLTPPASPSVAVAFDRAVRDADGVADALIAHGQDVATAAAIRSGLNGLEADLAKAETVVSQTAATLTDARDHILAVARAAGGSADDVSALRAFLRTRGAAVACRDARDAAAAELAEVEAALSSRGHCLAATMAVAMPDLAALGPLLAEADRRIDANRTLSAQRNTLTDQAAKQRSACAAAVATAGKTDAALADWVGRWQPVAAVLVRPEGESFATTADALAQIEDLRATEHKAVREQVRIDDMNAAIADLAAKVGQLSALSPEMAALPAMEAAGAFQRRLQTELQQAARCVDADRRIEQARQRCGDATIAADTAATLLDGMRAALRAETDESAEIQLQRVRSVTAARSESLEALRQLATQGGGLGVEALAARAAETTAEADTARISVIDASHRDRVPRIESAREASAAASAALDQAGSGTDAAEAAERREAAQALLSRNAEEALILHATHALLKAALDRQAASADQPLLARIGAVFRTITGGAQAGVRIEDAKDGQTMVALEADGTTRKMLDQLSEGTSDQLYLALRIAALEDYAAATSPLPFIADDILQTFDDARTNATLTALVELSNCVQVIVLTHHPHVGDLASRLPGDAVRMITL